MTRALLSMVLVGACSSNSGGPSGVVDAGGFAPAPHPPLPQAIDKGGPVLSSAHLVAMTFASDPLAAQLEAFVATLSGSKYVAEATAEYGVHVWPALPPVRWKETPPAALTDADVRTWLAAKLDGSHPEVPAPADGLLYVVFYPPSTTLSAHGAASCEGFSGYHEAVTVAGRAVPFAVVPRCSGLVGVPSPLDAATASASHEILEGLTDPFPDDQPAYANVDGLEPAWPLVFGGGELADLCGKPAAPYVSPKEMPFVVERSWSNASARAGHDPCLPSAAGPYFASVPVLSDEVTLTVAGASVKAQGVRIPVGQTRTVDLALFSDAPTDGPWSIRAIDQAEARGSGTPTLSFSLAPASGKNGDIVKLSITVLAKGPLGGEPFAVESTLAGRRTYAVGLVGE